MTNYTAPYQLDPVQELIWKDKYRYLSEENIIDTWQRVAKAAASNETDYEFWKAAFYDTLYDFKFIPAGRILAGAGTGRRVTLMNCFVMGRIDDSLDGIFSHLREAALTMQQGGGIGYDFSTLRPKNAPVIKLGSFASGPLSFMDVWHCMCETVMSAGSRRGAMMAVMRCDHPDIIDFITAKHQAGRLTNFNVSVGVTDAFMDAVKNDLDWHLVFNNVIYKTIKAKSLWDLIMKSTHEFSEPGVLFLDTINRENPLSYCEKIVATNPCGEQPMGPYSACLLGSMNLVKYVSDPFTTCAKIDWTSFTNDIIVAVRFLDNIIDISGYPLEAQSKDMLKKRRIGLGITGLGSALAMLSINYASDQAQKLTHRITFQLAFTAYHASAEIARAKGNFPLWDSVSYPLAPIFDRLGLRNLANTNMRNSHLTSIAPTGTISLLSGNVSSGIEPIFALEYERKILQPDGSHTMVQVQDYAVKKFRFLYPGVDLPTKIFTTAMELTPEQHINIVKAAAPNIDSAISKTINVPESATLEDIQGIYLKAYNLGLKGCTTYRPSPIRGSVLSVKKDEVENKVEAVSEPKPEPGMPATPLAASLSPSLAPRPRALHGTTYKLSWPQSPHAFYITINDEIQPDNTKRPHEIFINSKDMQNYAWVVGLTRMVSAIFRKGGDIDFVAEELQAVFEPRGGAYCDGKYMPSLVAKIGKIIDEHIKGLRQAELAQTEPNQVLPIKVLPKFALTKEYCPQCLQPTLKHEQGCTTCTSCAYSKC